MTIFDITKENVNEIPLIEWGENIDETFDGVLIVPTGEIHDSGYGCVQFIFCHGQEAAKRVDRGSDVLHIDGIGGYGDYHPTWNTAIPQTLPVRGWSIDCTPNGFLRLFSTRCRIKCDEFGLSSYSIYGIDERVNKNEQA